MFYSHSRIKKAVAFALIILSLALSSFSTSAQNPAHSAETLQEPPYQWPPSHNYDVQHYKIALSFDWANQSIDGETTITFKPFGPDAKEIEIDAGEMAIKSVKLAGSGSLK